MKGQSIETRNSLTFEEEEEEKSAPRDTLIRRVSPRQQHAAEALDDVGVQSVKGEERSSGWGLRS
jgi:hypothetical protein